MSTGVEIGVLLAVIFGTPWVWLAYEVRHAVRVDEAERPVPW